MFLSRMDAEFVNIFTSAFIGVLMVFKLLFDSLYVIFLNFLTLNFPFCSNDLR